MDARSAQVFLALWGMNQYSDRKIGRKTNKKILLLKNTPQGRKIGCSFLTYAVRFRSAGAGNDASRTAGSTMGTAAQFQQMAGSNNNAAGTMYGNIAQQAAANDPMKALMGAAGQAATMYFMSDENKKRGVRGVKEKALRGIERTPIKAWGYKDGVVWSILDRVLAGEL